MNTQNEEPRPDSGVPRTDEAGPEWFMRASEGIGPRIKEARGSMSQHQLADRLGVHVNTIGKVERGVAVPDARLLLEIGLATDTSPAWLLMGAPYGMRDGASKAGAAASLESADLVLVPGYDVEASAGNGSEVNDEQVIGRFAFKRSWLARKGLNPSHLAVVTARGDSMEPTVRDGDILLVDRNVTRISTDGIYLIERDNELYCKRLQSLFDGGVSIMSDNPRYEAQRLSANAAEGLRVTGRVIWIGGER